MLKKIKLFLKKKLCAHTGIESIATENPGPLQFLDIKAKCVDCGFESYDINKRAIEDYKISLADDALFQRNIEKFPEFYKNYAKTN
jgi:hypothetical protein